MSHGDDEPVIQYAHAGRWHTMTGHGVRPEDQDTRVAQWNVRDGWPRWRVADASTDRETGAPSEPVLDPTPFKEGEVEDLLRLGQASLERVLEPEERARLREITNAHRFERMTDEAQALITEIRAGRKPR
jgi:hypothetical protein